MDCERDQTVVGKLSHRSCQNYYIPYLAIKREAMKVALLNSSNRSLYYVQRGTAPKGKQNGKKHTTGGIPRWSPTLVLVARFSAYVWQSGRDAQFSLTYGRMYPISLNAVYVIIQLKCSRSLTLSKYGTPSTVLEGFTAIALTSHFQRMTRYLRRSKRSHALHSSGTALWYFQQLLRIKAIVRPPS
jgi:hypothetical protein